MMIMMLVFFMTLKNGFGYNSAIPQTKMTRMRMRLSLHANAITDTKINTKNIHDNIMEERVWRDAASSHADRIYALLKAGLVDLENDSGSKSKNDKHKSLSKRKRKNYDRWSRGIDSKNPVYNFLEEYYGIKGSKGARRLSRWSPPLQAHHDSQTQQKDFVLLKGATDDDVCGGMLHLRGAGIVHDDIEGNGTSMIGIEYDPCDYFRAKYQRQKNEKHASSSKSSLASLASPFVWYRSVLFTTQANDPVLYCHGLHEWAMQYWPSGAQSPPSAKYQRHLPLRVDQQTINAAVERRGVSCTHVDALRFFAKDALPLNKELLERADQIRVEQPGCGKE